MFSSVVNFRGKVDSIKDLPTENVTVGDSYLVGEDVYIRCDSKWEQISSGSNDYEPKELVPKICVSCGASFEGHTCPYCGTVYEWR